MTMSNFDTFMVKGRLTTQDSPQLGTSTIGADAARGRASRRCNSSVRSPPRHTRAYRRASWDHTFGPIATRLLQAWCGLFVLSKSTAYRQSGM